MCNPLSKVTIINIDIFNVCGDFISKFLGVKTRTLNGDGYKVDHLINEIGLAYIMKDIE